MLIPAGPKAGTLSDASSKPIFIAGALGWQKMATKMATKMVLRIDQNGAVQITNALNERLKFETKPKNLEIIPAF